MDLNNSLQKLIHENGMTPFRFFILVSGVATAVAAAMVEQSGSVLDWRDPGQDLILVIVAALCYGAIWLFVTKLAKARHR
jgi:hypothetical protein